MAKIKKEFVCNQCGYKTINWMGKCPDCGQWNTFEEEIIIPQNDKPITGFASPSVPAKVCSLSDINSGDEIRYITGIDELDRVLGGGLVPGEVVLISGDPGIGKSTLLLQMCDPLSHVLNILYVTGEESARQIKLRAIRLGVDCNNIYICANTDIEQIIATIESHNPQLVIIDSIQTMVTRDSNSSAGSISQIRECTQRLIRVAKGMEIPIFLVGHVNKDGAIAGPKVLEHMVDAVLYFEGERHLAYRILRGVKNRYGSTNEIGVFEMMDSGLSQVENPSMMLLSGRLENSSGTCVTCVMEGTRPILAEVQALVSKTSYAVPKRSANGFDFTRSSMLIAVLEKRCGFFMGNLDSYLNVVGGLRIDDPSSDLAIVVALLSNLLDKPINNLIAAFGEVGLAGEVRTVNRAQIRVGEAYRLGFRKILLPLQNAQHIVTENYPELELIPIKNVNDLKRILN